MHARVSVPRISMHLQQWRSCAPCFDVPPMPSKGSHWNQCTWYVSDHAIPFFDGLWGSRSIENPNQTSICRLILIPKSNMCFDALWGSQSIENPILWGGEVQFEIKILILKLNVCFPKKLGSMDCEAYGPLKICWEIENEIDGRFEPSCYLQGFLDQSETGWSSSMAAPRLLPFKAKVEEITSKFDGAKPAEGPAKKQCNAYEKQIQSMHGDVSLVKEYLFFSGHQGLGKWLCYGYFKVLWDYIYIYIYIYLFNEYLLQVIYTYIYIMCICVYTYLYIYIYPYIALYIYAKISTTIIQQMYIHTDLQTYIHIYIHTCTHPSILPSIHPYIHACMHAYIHIYICRYVFINIHIVLYLIFPKPVN